MTGIERQNINTPDDGARADGAHKLDVSALDHLRISAPPADNELVHRPTLVLAQAAPEYQPQPGDVDMGHGMWKHTKPDGTYVLVGHPNRNTANGMEATPDGGSIYVPDAPIGQPVKPWDATAGSLKTVPGVGTPTYTAEHIRGTGPGMNGMALTDHERYIIQGSFHGDFSNDAYFGSALLGSLFGAGIYPYFRDRLAVRRAAGVDPKGSYWENHSPLNFEMQTRRGQIETEKEAKRRAELTRDAARTDRSDQLPAIHAANRELVGPPLVAPPAGSPAVKPTPVSVHSALNWQSRYGTVRRDMMDNHELIESLDERIDKLHTKINDPATTAAERATLNTERDGHVTARSNAYIDRGDIDKKLDQFKVEAADRGMLGQAVIGQIDAPTTAKAVAHNNKLTLYHDMLRASARWGPMKNEDKGDLLRRIDMATIRGSAAFDERTFLTADEATKLHAAALQWDNRADSTGAIFAQNGIIRTRDAEVKRLEESIRVLRDDTAATRVKWNVWDDNTGRFSSDGLKTFGRYELTPKVTPTSSSPISGAPADRVTVVGNTYMQKGAETATILNFRNPLRNWSGDDVLRRGGEGLLAATVSLTFDALADRVAGKQNYPDWGKVYQTAAEGPLLAMALLAPRQEAAKIGLAAIVVGGAHYLDFQGAYPADATYSEFLKPNMIEGASVAAAFAMPFKNTKSRLAMVAGGWVLGKLANIGVWGYDKFIGQPTGMPIGQYLGMDMNIGARAHDDLVSQTRSFASAPTLDGFKKVVADAKDLHHENEQGLLYTREQFYATVNPSQMTTLDHEVNAALITGGGDSLLAHGGRLHPFYKVPQDEMMKNGLLPGMNLDLGGRALFEYYAAYTDLNVALNGLNQQQPANANAEAARKAAVARVQGEMQDVAGKVNLITGPHDIRGAYQKLLGYINPKMGMAGDHPTPEQFASYYSDFIKFVEQYPETDPKSAAKLDRDLAFLSLAVAETMARDRGSTFGVHLPNGNDAAKYWAEAKKRLDSSDRLDPSSDDAVSMRAILNSLVDPNTQSNIPDAQHRQWNNGFANPHNVEEQPY